MISDELVAEIKAAAEATERVMGFPWYADLDDVEMPEQDKRFIILASPANVRALIADRERLRAENDDIPALREENARMWVACPDGCECRFGTEDADRTDCACGGPCQFFCTTDEYVASLLAENERLLAAVTEALWVECDDDSARYCEGWRDAMNVVARRVAIAGDASVRRYDPEILASDDELVRDTLNEDAKRAIALGHSVRHRETVVPGPVHFTKFGHTRLVNAYVANGGSRSSPDYGWDDTLWVERDEDYYALSSPQLKSKRVLIVTREAWLAGKVVAPRLAADRRRQATDALAGDAT